MLRLMKDQRTPLPDPSGGTIPSPRDLDPSKMNESMPLPAGKENKGSSLSRKFSTKKLFLGGAPKQPSPTHPPMHTPSTAREVRDDASAHLEASAAAIAASSHLTASVNNQPSPSGLQSLPLSPSSPAYSNQPSSGGSYHSTATAPGRSFVRQPYDEPGSAHSSTWSNASTVVDQPLASARREDRRRAQAPAPSPREDEAPPGSARERDKGDRYVRLVALQSPNTPNANANHAVITHKSRSSSHSASPSKTRARSCYPSYVPSLRPVGSNLAYSPRRPSNGTTFTTTGGSTRSILCTATRNAVSA